MKKRYLILENGLYFEGEAFGADCTPEKNTGELVFTTGMCGYIETLTDPSYFGQIVVQTFPMIGNYGIIPADFEGAPCVNGYVVREWCKAPSNFRAEETIDCYLKAQGIPGICHLDTRALTKIIREQGVLNARLSDTKETDLPSIRQYQIQNAVASVTCPAPYEAAAKQPNAPHVALLDYGAKKNILRSLQERGCAVTVFPATATAEELLAAKPDGLLLSNGPGDPAENLFQIDVLRTLLGRLPIFGICLGHQLLALAAGGRTEKLKYGHRGVNQPVRDLFGGRTYITSQNHGYAVVSDSLPTGKLRFVNANDGTCEGIDYPEKDAFSVQFHPEACSGPKDTAFLFDQFITLMRGKRDAAR